MVSAASDVTVDLNHNSRLRSLTIHFRRAPRNPQYLSRMLSGAVSNEMEEIVIGLYPPYDDSELDGVGWEHVDAILERPQFSKLRSIRICTDPNLFGRFIDYFPRSYSRGILFIESHILHFTVL